MKNKEYGSDFHYIDNAEYRAKNHSPFFDQDIHLYFSGRAALKALLLYGIKKYSWKKLYVPSYYCHEVSRFVQDLDIAIESYNCNPLNNIIPTGIQDQSGTVLLVVNYFGLGSAEWGSLKNITVIEDLTHNLELINHSKADYVFGSLRKGLPVPVGGFVKSKHHLPLAPTTRFAEELALEKFSGMLLKKKYLEGDFHEKEVFRDLLILAEQLFENQETYSLVPPLCLDYLLSLNSTKISNAKKENSRRIKKLVVKQDSFAVLESDNNTEFALILKFKKSIDRDNLNEYLIKNMIYPMVLWPKQRTVKDKEAESQLLFVHIDFRYSSEDINFIIETINRFSCNV